MGIVIGPLLGGLQHAVQFHPRSITPRCECLRPHPGCFLPFAHWKTSSIPTTPASLLLWTGRVQQHHGRSRSRRRLPRFERGRPKKRHPQGSRLGRPSETAQNIFGFGFDDTTSSAQTPESGKVHGSSSKASAKPKGPTSGSPLGPITRWSSDQTPPRYCLSDLDRYSMCRQLDRVTLDVKPQC
jgi:hypothetical protein